MATTSAFARQLQSIALNSSHELDLRARRNAHAESLIFSKDVAVKQDWDTLYQICIEGYYELCQIDNRLKPFNRNLFSEQSKEQDRDKLNKTQNEALDTVLEQCLELLSPRLILRPAVKCLEWLVRRFRIHLYNIGPLLCTLLPYHEQPLFVNGLSLVSKDKLVDTWKWLRPYKDVNAHIPRHVVVYAMTNNNGFFDTFNSYILQAAQNRAGDKSLVKFWGTLSVEAVSARLGHAKSGRKDVQRQRTEDVLLKVLPVINDGIVLEDCPELLVTCYTITLVMASTGLLEDVVLSKLMEAISNTLRFSEINQNQVFVTMSILASQKEQDILPSRVLSDLMKVKDLMTKLKGLQPQHSVQRLLRATILTALKGLKKKNTDKKLDFVQQVLHGASGVVEDAEVTGWLVAIVSHLQLLDSDHSQQGPIRRRLLKILQQLHATGNFSPAFSRAAVLSLEQNVDLSALLQATLDVVELKEQADPDDMEVENSSRELEGKRRISEEASLVESFLAKTLPPVFFPLTNILQTCIDARTVSDFKLSKKKYLRVNEVAYPSFLVRVACGDRSSECRAAATSLLSAFVQCKEQKLNCQALLPYSIILLADPSSDVRKEAVDLVKSIAAAGSKVGAGEMLELYAQAQTRGSSVIDIDDVTRIVEQMLLPTLVECELDEQQIGHIIRHTLNGSPAHSALAVRHADIELKRNQRVALFQNLIHATLSCPLVSFKVGMLKILEGIHKVGSKNGSLTKLDGLKQLLQHWMRQTEPTANNGSRSESLELTQVDAAMATLMSGQDKHSVISVLNLAIEIDFEIRASFVTALFDRLIAIYKDMTEETKMTVSKALFDLSFSVKLDLARGARSTLHQLPLSTPILKSFLSESAVSTPSEVDGPSPKRRRLSHGRAPPSQLTEALVSAVPRLALTLELVEDSNPALKPELLPSLFEIMLVFRKLKAQSQPVSPYLLNLCLGSINAILEKQRTLRRPTLDLTVIRADVVTDFVRTTESPQVQASALQLLASLAALAPERVMHNIMPVFTFMGNDMLSKNDDHSVNVVNEAIDHIVPPLVETLKKQDEGNLIRSAGGLLTNFVLAFNHIPSLRKVTLYHRLLKRLGREDFGFALIAMLVVQRGEDEELPAFFGDVLKDFGPVERLVTYRHLMSLVKDGFAQKPALAQQLTKLSETSTGEERQNVALMLLETAADLLDSKYLKLQIKKTDKPGSDEASAMKTEFRKCLQQILGSIKDSKTYGAQIVTATRQCLSNLLELLPLAQLIESLPMLFEEMDGEDKVLQPVALRVLADQLQNKPPQDGKTAGTAIEFLERLRKMIESSDDPELTQAAIQCIDRISEVYGRKDVDSVVEIGAFLAGRENSTGHEDVGLLLCLASLVDVAKEATVPIAASILDKVFSVLDNTNNGQDAVEIYNATCSVASAILTHVPYMVNGSYILRLMSSLIEKGDLLRSLESTAMKTDTFNLLARKVDVDTLVPCLSTVWQATLAHSPGDLMVLLDVFATFIQAHPGSEVTRSSETISAFILTIFDTPAIQTDYENVEVNNVSEQSISGLVNNVAIKFVYKLNDTSFRPIFETWIEWADTPSRQIATFGFLRHFFDTLKSVVTSYANYIIAPANEILTALINKPHADLSETDKSLYRALFAVLTSTFEHDADAFYANPSHFSPLSANILAQISLAAHKPLRPLIFSAVIPSIVALATAVQDTPSHHLAINHALSQLRHSDSSHVRLASIETHIALTEDEEVGDEWINNVVSGTNNGEVGRDGGGSGETMIYVNEMLEDDDEDVERKVRYWVRTVRERVGEDVFEF